MRSKAVTYNRRVNNKNFQNQKVDEKGKKKI